jgi:hypothetical protein
MDRSIHVPFSDGFASSPRSDTKESAAAGRFMQACSPASAVPEPFHLRLTSTPAENSSVSNHASVGNSLLSTSHLRRRDQISQQEISFRCQVAISGMSQKPIWAGLGLTSARHS